MTAVTIPGLEQAPAQHEGLLAWVRDVAELTTPDRVLNILQFSPHYRWLVKRNAAHPGCSYKKYKLRSSLLRGFWLLM